MPDHSERDALAVVGSEVAIQAEALPARDGYLEPFMLRALGFVRLTIV